MNNEQIVENTLQHFGVIGMRWGVRRRRNAAATQRNVSEDHKKKVELKKKKISEMSNAELKALNERLQLEKTYKDLSRQDVSAGQKFVADILRDSGRELIKDYVKTGVKVGVKTAARRLVR